MQLHKIIELVFLEVCEHYGIDDWRKLKKHKDARTVAIVCICRLTSISYKNISNYLIINNETFNRNIQYEPDTARFIQNTTTKIHKQRMQSFRYGLDEIGSIPTIGTYRIAASKLNASTK